ncbi:MAG TPA: hypothetical protein VMS87_09500, partial [Roseiarcus sp.]|nr:hypothetical protein [Roseiarcus sp.]
AAGMCRKCRIDASALSTSPVAGNEKAMRMPPALQTRLKANFRRDRDFPLIDMQSRPEFFRKGDRYRASEMGLGLTLFHFFGAAQS